MKKKAVLVFVLFAVAATFAAAQEIQGLITQGDELYVNREDPAVAKQSLDKYLEALKLDPNSYQALWRAGKVIYSIGMAARTDDEKKKIFNDGVNYCKRAVAIKPDGVEGHFWLGVNYGKYGEARGVLKSLFLKNDIMREMNAVVKLNEAYEGAGAYRVLGRVCYKVPGLFGGSKQKSKMYLEKGKKICPTNTLTLIYLAETYKALDQDQEAIKTLEEIVNLTPDARWIPETKADKAEAAKLLQKYKK
jgi:tetratricopeptide (TPR) repeat protein